MNFKEEFYNVSKQARLVGSSVVIVKNDAIVEEVNYGYMSLEENKNVNNDTIYRIASISKVVVAMAVMSLFEESKASVNDDIGDILGFKIRNPHHPDKKITIKMLMTQTSSITDGYDDENPAYDNIKKGYNGVNGTFLDVKLKELLVKNDGPYYSDNTWDKEIPGTKFIYSNFGCGILACIVEALSGELFTDYVERKILKPLNMDASFRACNIKNNDNIASLYYTTKDENNPYRLARNAISFYEGGYPIFDLKENYRGPAGGLFTSMRDLTKIMGVLLNDGIYKGVRILKKETVDFMQQLHWYGNGPHYTAKGLQLKFDEFDGRLFKGHTGSAYGVISYMFFNKEEQLGICFITNGGYYKYKKSGFYDVELDVFNAFLDKYWPKQEQVLTLTYNLDNNYAALNNRVIYLEDYKKYDGKEFYFSIQDFASILNLIPKVEDDKIIISKNNKTITVEEGLVSVLKTLEALEINYTIENNTLIFKY